MHHPFTMPMEEICHSWNLIREECGRKLTILCSMVRSWAEEVSGSIRRNDVQERMFAALGFYYGEGV